jgi:hypothetical protein
MTQATPQHVAKRSLKLKNLYMDCRKQKRRAKKSVRQAKNKESNFGQAQKGSLRIFDGALYVICKE